jgi:hypothetical protein
MVEAAISMRDAVLEVWKTDRIPCNNMYDAREIKQAEAEALAKAVDAVPSPDDPPEFAVWLDTLRRPNLTNTEWDEVFDAMYAYFEPDEGGAAT